MLVWFVVVVVACVPTRMAAPALAVFLAAPSLDQLGGMRRSELFAVADHYKISVPRQALKAEMLELKAKKRVGSPGGL